MSADATLDESSETRVTIASGPLVGPVLRRVVGMLAARADLPLDRLDDAVLVADVIGSRAGAYSVDGLVTVFLITSPRSLGLRVGPLRPGGAGELVVEAKIPDVGNVIERLSDEVEVVQADSGEFLRVALAYPG